MKTRHRVSLATFILVALGVGCWFVWPRKSQRVSAEHHQAVLDEVLGADVVIRYPTPDPSGLRVAYVYAGEQGRGLFVVDLTTLETTKVEVTNEVSRIGGWSPDGRYLAFVQVAPEATTERVLHGSELASESWVTLYDRIEGSVFRLTESIGVVESYFFWLTTNSYLITTRKLTNDLAEMFMGRVGEPAVDKVSNYMPEFLVIDEKRAAYAYKGTNIFELEIKPLLKSARWGWDDNSRTVRQLSHFGSRAFDAIRWLRYSVDTGQFLFCARPTNSIWRYLFQFDPATENLVQLNEEDTYNGQWLEGGTGFAYVGNSNNSFFLAIRPENVLARTNLFTQGSVATYQVSADGERVFVVASLGVEPQGLWEYRLNGRALRKVVEGVHTRFMTARIVEPMEIRVKSLDGLEIPCFWFKPAAGSTDDMTQSKRHPAVIFLSPRTGQFQRSYDARSQLLANLGFHFIAVNYRGCDGYGRDYANLSNPNEAARDIMAVRDRLLQSPEVDERNIFLSSSSDGSVVAYELLAERPDLWRGVALENPTVPGMAVRSNPTRLPPMFIATGDRDAAEPALRAFVSWASDNGVDAQSVVYTNAGHIIYKAIERKDKLDRVSTFLLDHLK